MNEGQYYSYMALYIASADLVLPKLWSKVPLASSKSLSPIYALYVRFPLIGGRAMGSFMATTLYILGKEIAISYIYIQAAQPGVLHCLIAE